MTLREKFEPYANDECVGKLDNSENCVDVADEFALLFLEWIMDNCELSEDKSLYSHDSEDYSNENLLEIFKKEKGL